MLPAQLEALPSCAASILEDGRAALAGGGDDLIAGVGLDFMVAERRAFDPRKSCSGYHTWLCVKHATR